MASTYRDRSAEFRSLTQTLRRTVPSPSPSPDSNSNNDAALKPQIGSPSFRSEFNKQASRIGLGLHETSQKISRLAQVAKRSSMFNDPTVEIQELTAVIKNEITTLNSALADLQTLRGMEIAGGGYTDDSVVHCNAVSDDLQARLLAATKRLKEVLTTRTENIKAHENRKQLFSANAASRDSNSNNPFLRQAKVVAEPPPWSNSANPLDHSHQSESSPLLPNNTPVGNQLRRRSAVENSPSNHMQMSMLQEEAPRQESYSESRTAALHNVESTITELSGIFTNLATMVAHQGELAIRIDDNMDESLANVENARSALLRHLNRISSNRWLLIKIFAVVILFLMIFIFFIA